MQLTGMKVDKYSLLFTVKLESNEIHLYALLKIFLLDMCLVVWSAG